MIEERIFDHSLFFPVDIHHRNGVVKHAQGDVFGRESGKDRSLGLLPGHHRQRPDMVQVGVGDENRLQLAGDQGVVRKAFGSEFFGVQTRIKKKGKTVNLQKIGVGSDFLPAAENRESPGHGASNPRFLMEE